MHVDSEMFFETDRPKKKLENHFGKYLSDFFDIPVH